jgi:hypothetical protein
MPRSKNLQLINQVIKENATDQQCTGQNNLGPEHKAADHKAMQPKISG